MPDYLDTIGPLDLPRYRPAFLAIHELLSDGKWHRVDEVNLAAKDASDLKEKTIDNLIRWGHKRGRNAEWRYRGRGQAKELRVPETTDRSA